MFISQVGLFGCIGPSAVLACALACGLFYTCWLYTLDAAVPAVHAPVHSAEAIASWTSDECYWSSSYPEAREKFVFMGNALRT